MSHHAHDTDIDAFQLGRANRRPLVIALAITGTFLIVEAIGGVLTNSLALLADAGHMATDAAALALSLFAIWLAGRPATPQRSFGFYRAEVLAALLNAGTLVAISLYIFWEAFNRIALPPEVDSGPMLVVAVAGLAANVLSAWVLMRGGDHRENLNVRGAFLHVVGDMLGSVGAIVAALVMLVTGWYLADPILSAGIGLLILWSSWRLLRESVEVLLEATPARIDTMRLRTDLQQVDGVDDVHDVHVWTVTSGFIAMTAHVEVSGRREWLDILNELNYLARDQFGIAHVTLQPEPSEYGGNSFQGCSIDTEQGRNACWMSLPGYQPTRNKMIEPSCQSPRPNSMLADRSGIEPIIDRRRTPCQDSRKSPGCHPRPITEDE